MLDNHTGYSIDLTALRGFTKGESGTGVSEQLPDGTLTGDHMRVKLEQVLVGVELADWKGKVTRLVLVRVLYENLTDYLI